MNFSPDASEFVSAQTTIGISYFLFFCSSKIALKPNSIHFDRSVITKSIFSPILPISFTSSMPIVIRFTFNEVSIFLYKISFYFSLLIKIIVLFLIVFLHLLNVSSKSLDFRSKIDSIAFADLFVGVLKAKDIITVSVGYK